MMLSDYTSTTELGDKVCDILTALDQWIAALAGIDDERMFTGLTCDEVEKLAHLIRLAGYDDLAARAIAWHATDDDQDEDHFLPNLRVTHDSRNRCLVCGAHIADPHMRGCALGDQ